MVGDETCQSIVQRTWGTDREIYPYIMFKYPLFETPLAEEAGRPKYYGLVVVDFVSAYVRCPPFSKHTQSEV